ncbi:hypothetical protein LXL04_024375 [Taraxacum kok-saghyz]
MFLFVGPIYGDFVAFDGAGSGCVSGIKSGESEFVAVSEIRFEGGLRNLLAPFNGQERSGPIATSFAFVAEAKFAHETLPPRAHGAVCTPVARGPCPRPHHEELVAPTPNALKSSMWTKKDKLLTNQIRSMEKLKTIVLGSFENSYIPENPRTPPISYISQTVIPFKKPTSEPSKTGFETKQKTVHICTKKKFAHMQSFWKKKKSFFRKFFFATGLIFERFLAPRSRFFEKAKSFFGKKLNIPLITFTCEFEPYRFACEFEPYRFALG